MTYSPEGSWKKDLARGGTPKRERRPRRQLAPIGWITLLAVIVAVMSFVFAVLSVLPTPSNICGYDVSTWNWSFLPFGVDCEYSGAEDYRGPLHVFHEFNTTAFVTFVVSMSVAVLSIAGQVLVAVVRRAGRVR